MIPDEAVEAAAKVMASQTDEPPYGESPELDAEYRRDAREILEAAAPYIQRTITTVEELEELPVGSVIRTSGTAYYDPFIAVKVNKSDWAVANEDNMPLMTGEIDDLPATVLHLGKRVSR